MLQERLALISSILKFPSPSLPVHVMCLCKIISWQGCPSLDICDVNTILGFLRRVVVSDGAATNDYFDNLIIYLDYEVE